MSSWRLKCYTESGLSALGPETWRGRPPMRSGIRSRHFYGTVQRLKLEFQPMRISPEDSLVCRTDDRPAPPPKLHRLKRSSTILSLRAHLEIKPEALPLPEILKELAAIGRQRRQRPTGQIRGIAANLPRSSRPESSYSSLVETSCSRFASDAARRTLTLEAKTPSEPAIFLIRTSLRTTRPGSAGKSRAHLEPLL